MEKEDKADQGNKHAYTKEEKGKDIAGFIILALVFVTLVPALSQGPGQQAGELAMQQSQAQIELAR